MSYRAVRAEREKQAAEAAFREVAGSDLHTVGLSIKQHGMTQLRLVAIQPGVGLGGTESDMEIGPGRIVDELQIEEDGHRLAIIVEMARLVAWEARATIYQAGLQRLRARHLGVVAI